MWGGFIKIVTVHDLVPLIYPKLFRFADRVFWNYIVPINLKNANKIIAVSESTKQDLIKLLNIESKKIVVIPESYNETTFLKRDFVESMIQINDFLKNKKQQEVKINQKIILSVGTLQPRKNVPAIIKVFNEIAVKDVDLVLVIIGKKGWNYKEIISLYETSPFKERIFLLGFVPDEIVACFYNIAILSVYISFYEGFGLPILEAMACGCPVISSNISSMPEIVENAGILVNPYNLQEIKSAIEYLTSNDNKRKELSILGLNQVKKFSWKKCAEMTFALYKSYENTAN
jgi:glycosyltransferase involved in cell wall biosynthesis